MNRSLRTIPVVCVCAGLVFAGAATGFAVSNNTAPELTMWGIPPQQTVTPQTDAQDAYNQEHGRPLPTSELLQPTLDASIPGYKPAKNKNSIKGTYKCAASDVLAALSKSWVGEFQKIYPKVTINIKPPYAGSLGALALIDGKLDCVFVSRELKPTDVEAFTNKFGYAPTSIPISGGSYRQFGFLDSVGFVVNKANPLNRLTLDQLDEILSTTHNRGGAPITTWGQLGITGAWKDKPIHIYGLQPWNGFEEFARERVLNYNGRRGEWRSAVATNSTPADPNVTWDKTVFKLAQHVNDDPYGLAYTGMAYVDQPVKVLALSNHANDPTYAPTYENVASAQYPLSRLVYLNLNKKPGAAMDPTLRELIEFIISKQGQRVVSNQGVYLPLRGEQTTTSEQLLRNLP